MIAQGWYFDQTRCTSCFTCVVACKDWHSVPEGPASWIRVKPLEEGLYPDLQLSFLVQSCFHCAKPACLEVCPVQAIRKREDNGLVVVDREVCIGKDRCGLCSKACPYDAPQFAGEENAKMQKCDLCAERLLQGLKPICVNACPMRALDAGAMEELIGRYGEGKEAQGFVYFSKLEPAIIFKRKMKASQRDR